MWKRYEIRIIILNYKLVDKLLVPDHDFFSRFQTNQLDLPLKKPDLSATGKYSYILRLGHLFCVQAIRERNKEHVYFCIQQYRNIGQDFHIRPYNCGILLDPITIFCQKQNSTNVLAGPCILTRENPSYDLEQSSVYFSGFSYNIEMESFILNIMGDGELSRELPK